MYRTGMALLSLLCGAAALAATRKPADPPPPPQSARVALLALRPLGTEQGIADSLEAFLRAEVDRLRGVSLITRASTLEKIATLPEAEQSCEGDVRCLARLGRACEVDKLLYGTVATLGDSYVLDLKLVDVARLREQDRQSVTFSGDQAIMIDGVRAITTQLLAPEQYIGALELKLDRPGAVVFIDGQPVGTTPLERVEGITPGQRGLKIVLKGYRDFDRFIDVRFARVTVVNVSLSGDTIDAEIEAAPVEVVDAQGSPAEAIAKEVEAPAPTTTTVPAPSSPLGSPLVLGGVGLGALGTGLLVGGVAILGGMYLSMTPHVEDDGDGPFVSDPASYATLRDAYGWWPAGWTFVSLGVVGLVAGAGLVTVGLLQRDDAGAATLEE